MTTPHKRNLSLRASQWLLCCTLLYIVRLPVFALQAPAQDAGSGKLATGVNLELGATTLAQVLKSLSAQTGLVMEAEPYLLDRKMLVQMKHLSAREALDTLTELHDWRWWRTEEGHIRLSRPKLNLPADADSIPARLRAAMPVDMRTYLGIGLAKPEREKLSLPMRGGNAFRDGNMQFEQMLSLKTIGFMQTSQRELLTLLMLEFEQGASVAYSKLTPQLQEQLLGYLILKTVRHLGADAFDGGTIYRAFDPAYLILRVNRIGQLESGRVTQEGNHTSFSGVAHPLPPTQ